MSTVVKLDLGDDLLALLQKTVNGHLELTPFVPSRIPPPGSISSGRAAELLGMPRMDFIHYASRLGIPYIDMTKDEWEAEKAALDAWPRS